MVELKMCTYFRTKPTVLYMIGSTRLLNAKNVLFLRASCGIYKKLYLSRFCLQDFCDIAIQWRWVKLFFLLLTLLVGSCTVRCLCVIGLIYAILGLESAPWSASKCFEALHFTLFALFVCFPHISARGEGHIAEHYGDVCNNKIPTQRGASGCDSPH